MSDSNNPFGSLPGMPDIGQIMQQAQRMREELVRSHDSLGQKTVEASAGGGMVSAVATGTRELVKLRIDPQVIDAKDPQMLQDLIVAAVNQALAKAKSLEEEEMRRTAMGMGLPPGML
ncbi:MAG: YbaB/EbfC family nucleoid-associated protein [Polyangia bacterium]|jgi:DNA-binding YbaB/EbfC family protein